MFNKILVRFCYRIQNMRWIYFSFLLVLFLLFVIFFCEYVLYYAMISPCSWPLISYNANEIAHAMILADVHMIGPRKGHPIDKWRREWQMHRAFQSSLTMFKPDVVFMLGDIFDEGTYVDNDEFQDYVDRFRSNFYTKDYTQLVAVVGNHDIGFHYRAHPYFVYRFDQAFNTTGVALITVKNNHFVTLNSVAMEGDNCDLCAPAMEELNEISKKLKCSQGHLKCSSNNLIGKYSQPIILQHYPTYRKSDQECIETENLELSNYREKWEVISRKSTIMIGDLLNPRVAFSGHSHRYCRLEKNLLGIEEYTITSYNWRNRPNPAFLLATFTPENYRVVKCNLPTELTIILCYCSGGFIVLLLIIIKLVRSKSKGTKEV